MFVTFCLGAGFLKMETHDFITMFHDGASPDRSGYPLSVLRAGRHARLSRLQRSHLDDLDGRAARGVRSRREGTKLNLIRLGLFWHFLDVIWVVIFSVVYLQGLIR